MKFKLNTNKLWLPFSGQTSNFTYYNIIISQRSYSSEVKKKSSVVPIQYSLGNFTSSMITTGSIIKPYQTKSKFKRANTYLVGVFYLVRALNDDQYQLNCFKILLNPTEIPSNELCNIVNYLGASLTNYSYHYITENIINFNNFHTNNTLDLKMNHLDLSNSFFRANLLKDSIPNTIVEDFKVDVNLFLQYSNYANEISTKLEKAVSIISDINHNEILCKEDLDGKS